MPYDNEDWRPRHTSMVYDGTYGRADKSHSLQSFTFDDKVYILGYYGEISQQELYRTAEQWHKEKQEDEQV